MFAIFYGDLLVTIRKVKMAKVNYYGDIYFLQLLEPLVQEQLFWPIVKFNAKEGQLSIHISPASRRI